MADAFSADERMDAITGIEQLPRNLVAAVAGLSDEQLATPYRPGGWTLRQVVHHVADSHMNAFIRIRLGLTQLWPGIVPYDENRWAQLEDARLPVAISLELLQALHTRWVCLLRSLGEEDWKQGYLHPESGRQSIEQAVILYDWHGRHHTAHIAALTARMGWRA